MTVKTPVNKVHATGNSSAVTFSFSPIVIFASTNLKVVTTVIATGVETVRPEGTGDSAWSLGITTFPATGSIGYPADGVTPLTSTHSITIKRVLTLEQQTKLSNRGGYLPKTQEKQFDKLLMIDLQQQDDLDRAFKFPVSYEGNIDVNAPLPVASGFLKVNSSGTALEWGTIAVTTGSASDVNPYTSSLTAANAGVGTAYSRDDHVHLLPVISVAKGGTGATDQATARSNLGITTLLDRAINAQRLAFYNHAGI